MQTTHNEVAEKVNLRKKRRKNMSFWAFFKRF